MPPGGSDGSQARPDARGRILGRVRQALAGREGLGHPGSLDRGAGFPGTSQVGGAGGRDHPARGGQGGSEELASAFSLAFRASGGEVVVLESPAKARDWLDEFARGFGSAAVSPDVPPLFRPALPDAEPDAAQLGVSVAVGAAANTGSLLLSSRYGRALQLLPPVHLVWVDVARVFSRLGEVLEAARGEEVLPAVLALHSGPSKSADIGRIMVTGVHGPGRVMAALVDGWSREG